MSENLIVAVLLTIIALVFITLALIFALTFIPGFTFSGCWMSAQSQTKQLVGWYLEGPAQGPFGSEKRELEKTLKLGKCVEKTIFTNKPMVMCRGVNIAPPCPAGKKSYIVTCRDPVGIGEVEKFFKNVQEICVGFSKPLLFSKNQKILELEGKRNWCVKIVDTGDKYEISAKEGICKKEKE